MEDEDVDEEEEEEDDAEDAEEEVRVDSFTSAGRQCSPHVHPAIRRAWDRCVTAF